MGGQILRHLHGDNYVLRALQDQHRTGVAVYVQGGTAYHGIRIQIDGRILQHNAANVIAVGHSGSSHCRTAHGAAHKVKTVRAHDIPTFCRFDDGVQILHLLQDLFLIGVITETDQELRELAFRADVTADDTEDFIAGMKSIIRMPFESILQMLCTMNHVMNGETLSLKDITIYDAEQERLLADQGRQQAAQKLSARVDETQSLHNTLSQEQALLRMVRKGDTAALKEWVSRAPAIRGGVLAKEQLRQKKNTFIVTVTLVSRAAIRGGMEVEDAFSHSDSYIQQCELLSSPVDILNLQYRMLLDYTERVERLRLGKQPSKLTIDVANYIQHHMSEPITAEKMAAELFLNRSYLSRKFKEETEETLTDFILKEKTEEAKRLLRYSDKSLTAIASYLGFSSASHFSRVFKAYVGSTPSEYREKHQ